MSELQELLTKNIHKNTGFIISRHLVVELK